MTDELKKLQAALAAGRVGRRDFMVGALGAGLTLGAANSIFASSAMANTPTKGGHMVLGMSGGSATDTNDPATYTNDVDSTVGRLWGNTLVAYSPTGGAPTPVLAESYEGTNKAKTWVFNLRKGVQFSNGKEMTADDVVATIKRHSDENSKSGALGIMRGITDIKADGPHTVVINLETANADLPFLMADYHLVIQPNGGLDDPQAAIGTGAYILEVAEHGVRYLAKKNPNYWNPNEGHVDSVELLVINDLTARMSALQSGKVHMINRVDPKTISFLKRAKNISIENTAGRGHYVFIMHCDKGPFANNDLRLAMKYAMDREAMVKQILRGYGTVGNDMPINTAYPYFPDSIEQRAYDPDKAKFHFKKSGHDGPVLLRTSNAAFNGAEDAAVLYQQQAAKAGIQLDVKREPADGYWSNVWNVQPFCTSYWGGRPTQDQMYSVAYYSKADWNDTKWFRPGFDKLLFEARAELDGNRRKELYTEMGTMVRDDGGLICPMFNDFIDAISTDVGGYIRDPNGMMSNGYAPLRCWLKDA
ncbi:ABC transporter substrate-binding protein [Rhodovibrionaceae bacterium A322]